MKKLFKNPIFWGVMFGIFWSWIAVWGVAWVGVAGADETEIEWVKKRMQSVGGDVEWAVGVQKKNDWVEKTVNERLNIKMACPLCKTETKPLGALVHGSFVKGCLQTISHRDGSAMFSINNWHPTSNEGIRMLYVCPNDGIVFVKDFKIPPYKESER